MLKIENAILVLPDRLARENLYIRNGKIAQLGGDMPAERTLNAAGAYVSPGFIDTHVHGGGGADFSDGGQTPMRIGAHTHLLHGTTTLCPTTMSCSFETLLSIVDDFVRLRAESGKGGLPHLPGLHLEGPYFSPAQAGAQPPAYIYPPRPAEYREILAHAEGGIVKWSFAPELPGAMAFCDALVRAGVTPGMGHTDATADEVRRGYEHGARFLTHFYSGMSTITRRGGYRVLGALEAGYLIDDLWVEIIADGAHLPPDLLRLILKCKCHERIHLVSDAMRGATMPQGESLLGRLGEGVPCIIEDGIAKMPDRTCFAGSVATADRLVRTLYRKAGCTLVQAVRFASENPATLLGFSSKGRIAEGMDADLVFFDENVHIQRVMLCGETVHEEN